MSRSSSVARARWSALLTEATLVSSSSATSLAFQRSTSHRISTARWRAGQVLEGGHEGQADRVALHGQLGRIALGADQAGRDRLDQGDLGQRVQVRLDRLRRTGRSPSAAPGGCGRSACRGRRWWRSGTARSGTRRGPRSGRSRARPAGTCPARRPRPRTASRASGSSSRSARSDAARAGARGPPAPTRLIPARGSSYVIRPTPSAKIIGLSSAGATRGRRPVRGPGRPAARWSRRRATALGFEIRWWLSIHWP